LIPSLLYRKRIRNLIYAGTLCCTLQREWIQNMGEEGKVCHRGGKGAKK